MTNLPENDPRRFGKSEHGPVVPDKFLAIPTHLVTRRPVNQDLIDSLKDLLAQAEKGEVTSMAAVLQAVGRESITVVVDDAQCDLFKTLGQVEYLKTRLIHRIES